MLQRIKDFFVPAGQFRMAPRRGGFPDCNIRLLREDDIEACEAIYRLNEPIHFPTGYFAQFSDWLRHRRSLIMVAEQEGAVLALGGVNAQEQGGRHVACLSFGMVHPAHHRQGFGTALLLARLALLRTTQQFSFVALTTVGGSETFYGRFGFSFVRAIQATPEYLEKHYVVRLSERDKAQCAGALAGIWAPPQPGESEPLSLSSLTEFIATDGRTRKAASSWR